VAAAKPQSRDPHAASASETDMQALTRLNAGYIRSVVESDVDWFDGYLSADFLNSNPDGSLVDKAGFLAQIARPMTLQNFAIEDVRIRILGGCAIIHARTTYRKPDGQAGGGRYTDIWEKRDGRWLCVAAHVSRG
jgi:ketosteroid isomerase-like protein